MSIKLDFLSDVRSLPFGTWTLACGLDVNQYGTWHRRSNLSGVHFQTVADGSAKTTDLSFREVDGKQVPVFGGAYTEIFEQLRDILGFTYSVELSPDRTWGGIDANGAWTGIKYRICPWSIRRWDIVRFLFY